MAGKHLALTFDRTGRVLDVLRDDAGLLPPDARDVSLARLVDPEGLGELFELLVELQQTRSVVSRSLLMRGGETALHLRVAAARREHTVLLIGGDDEQAILDMTEVLAGFGGAQPERIRRVIREHGQRRPPPAPDVLDRMAEIGNELAVMHRRLARSERESERTLERKDLLLGMVAHDMRSPLTAIGGFSELLLDATVDADQREMLGEIEQACQAMEQLVQGALDWARIETGRLTLAPESLDLNALIEGVLAARQNAARRREVTLAFEPEPALPAVTLDPLRLRQVLENLCANAIEASRRGAVVTVAAEVHADAVVLTIHGHDVGIELAEWRSMFAWPSEASRGRPVGAGLGLAIVERVVDAHGGSLDARQAPGGGTLLSVRLPLAEG